MPNRDEILDLTAKWTRPKSPDGKKGGK